MRSTSTLLAAVAGLASVAYAQEGVPSCGQPCITPYISGANIAGCGQLDVACICANHSFLSGISCCLETNCNPADQQTAVNFALNLCAANGVTNLPTAVSVLCTSSVTSAVSSATPATGSTTTTSGGSSTTSAASAASKSSVSSSTTSAASASGSSTAAAATETKSSAAQNVAGMGAGVVGGLLAFAAAL